MNDFAELGPLMLVSAPPSALLFAVAVVCGVATVWFKVRTVPLKEFRLLNNPAMA